MKCRGMFLAGLGLLALSAWAANPVTVTEQMITHRVKTSVAYDGQRLYPAAPPKEQTDPLNAQLRARKAAVEQEFLATRQAAVQAKKAWDALPRARKATPEADALKAVWGPVYAELAKAQEADPEVIRLNGELKKLTDAMQPVIEMTLPQVTLNNGLVEVKVVPTLAMRVLNAIDLTSGRSFSGTENPRQLEEQDFRDVIGWDAGYVEASFPYFEHGTAVRQSAGYRVIKDADGSVTVAMNMRFTQHQDPRHMSRYGRYSPRTLSSWITLKPGESRYTATYRLDNPMGLRQASRLWTDIIYQTGHYGEEQIIYPAGYIMPHGGQSVTPFYAAGGTRQWQSVSHFALYPDYSFCGIYAPAADFNSLNICDGPGMKLYTGGGEGGVMELWRGSTTLFEYPGELQPAFVPVQYTITNYTLSGVGRVAYADTEIALTQQGDTYTLSATHPAKAEVLDGAGHRLAAGAIAPNAPLRGLTGAHFVVKLDGVQVADVRFPLSYADTRDRWPAVKALGSIYRLESEENSNHVGAPTGRDAMAALAARPKGQTTLTDAEISLAYTAYRHGHLQLVADFLQNVKGNPDADYLKGLIAWEQGQPVDFGIAGIDANYHRALLAVQQGHTREALARLDALIAARPTVYYPRLLRAYLAKDVAAARALAAENPALPEAQLVLELLGVQGAREAKEALIADNPDAPEQVEQFRLQLTKGQWQFPRRYAPTLPKEDRP